MTVAKTVSLTEVGRKFSAKSLEALKGMVATGQALIDEQEAIDAAKAKQAKPAKGKAKAAPVAESARGETLDIVEAALRLADSHDSRRQALRQAIVAKMIASQMIDPDRCYVWIRDVFDTCVIACCGDDMWQFDYTIDSSSDDPAVTLGEPIEVELSYTPCAGDAGEMDMGEAAREFVAQVVLQEGKAVAADGSALIKVITPGWGTSGYYPAAVIQRDGPKVFTEGTKMYADHPTAAEEAARPERSVKDLAAVFTADASWQDSGPDGPGLYAPIRVFEAWQDPINDMADEIGVSIRADGTAKMGSAEGRKGPIVESITRRKSVDFVTDAGRGGKILSLREAAAMRHQTTPPTHEEAEMPLSEAEGKALQESVNALQKTNQDQATLIARLTEANLLREAKDFVAGRLAGVNLPDVTKTRLTESLAANPPAKDGALDTETFGTRIDEAAKAEAVYLATVTGSGQVRGMGLSESLGGGEPPKPEDTQKTLTEAFTGLGMSAAGAALAAKGRG